jgi:D-alanyl-D-alanine carboxypeptidase/D-alanyl-D-alanine-endopeptidase (penicillin-binding protein 4)
VTRGVFVVALVVVLGLANAGRNAGASLEASTQAQTPAAGSTSTLASDLDAIFAAPVFARALVGIRVESLRTGEVLYQRNSEKLVIPASNMKIVTMSVAAERLGWNHRFETTLDAAGAIKDGTLQGDLVVTGTGDPSIGSSDAKPARLFDEWADALQQAGIKRVAGRIIGDDNAFDDEAWGPGWAWDYLSAAYAAPSGALSYNENIVIARITPGRDSGVAATIEIGPAGYPFEIVNEITTGEPKSPASVELERNPGSARLVFRGRVPVGGAVLTRTTTIENPTTFFVEGLRLVLASRGIIAGGGAWDIDQIKAPVAPGARQRIALHKSEPLSALGGYFLKDSQNFYGEMLLKAIGRSSGRAGSTTAGRQAARETLAAWGVPADSLVVYDGSGLSRYNYVSADAIVLILKRVWNDDKLRGPFVAALPVGGHDGTLSTRMRKTALDRHVQAKTGTISNVRSLSGYVETKAGEKLVFSMIANHFTGTSAQVDAVVEAALLRLVDK